MKTPTMFVVADPTCDHDFFMVICSSIDGQLVHMGTVTFTDAKDQSVFVAHNAKNMVTGFEAICMLEGLDIL